jgi:hypothetical protein
MCGVLSVFWFQAAQRHVFFVSLSKVNILPGEQRAPARIISGS